MYHSIVVPLDGSSFAEQAVAPALTIAEACGAKVTLVRAWDPANYRYTSELTPPIDDPAARDRLAAIEYLDGVASRLRPATSAPVDVAVVAGPAAEAIKEHLTSLGADLVVMTTHGLTGWSRAWIGSVADALARVVSVPVLLCRPLEAPTADAPSRFERVLIPLDGSPEGEQILPHVAALGASGVRFILLRVERPVLTPVHPYTYAAPAWETDQSATEEVVNHARQYLDAIAAQLRAECPKATVEVDVRVADHAAAAIIDASREYATDLVAVMTHARRAARLVLGSVADKVLRGTHGPVMLLRPAQEATPDREAAGVFATRMSGTVI